ncbi:alpha/beta hydrolase [Candidatus Latescibacterota bacterium]
MRYLITFALLLLVSCQQAPSIPEPESNPLVTLQGTEVRTLISQAVEGMEYKLWIAVPGNYAQTSDTYPVVYLLDAKDFFCLHLATYRSLTWFNDIPPLILVGISFEGDMNDNLYHRSRDFTPTYLSYDQLLEKYGQQEANLTPISGGAQNFLRFIEEELIPFIESEYRTEPGNRGLFGISYSGLFGAYVLFNRPDLFNRYFLASPSVYWDNFFVFANEEAYAASHDALPAKVYFTAGTEEDELYLDGFEKLKDILNTRDYEGLEFTAELLEGENHTTGIGLSYSRAFRRLYGR